MKGGKSHPDSLSKHRTTINSNLSKRLKPLLLKGSFLGVGQAHLVKGDYVFDLYLNGTFAFDQIIPIFEAWPTPKERLKKPGNCNFTPRMKSPNMSWWHGSNKAFNAHSSLNKRFWPMPLPFVPNRRLEEMAKPIMIRR